MGSVIPDYPQGLTFEKVWAMFQETDRLIKETARGLEEANKLITKNGEQIGGLHNSFGEIAEHLVAPGIAERFNERGFHFDAISPGGIKIFDDKKNIKAEVDLLLGNGEAIIAIEVKARVVYKDIEHHLERLEILKEYCLKQNDTRKIYGAIAAAIFWPTEKKAALKAGLYVLEQSGDTMKLELPDGFVPREW